MSIVNPQPTGWDPDAVPPPCGDVYTREAPDQDGQDWKGWLIAAFCLVVTLAAVRGL